MVEYNKVILYYVEESYKVAIAAGLATGHTRDLAKRHEIEEMLDRVHITKIK